MTGGVGKTILLAEIAVFVQKTLTDLTEKVREVHISQGKNQLRELVRSYMQYNSCPEVSLNIEKSIYIQI